MPNTQTGPYPVLFAKNTTRARISLQTTVGGTRFRRSLGPGETKEVPWVIAKSAGFHRLWSDGSLEVSDKFDFGTTLDELPSIGADGGPAQWEEIEGVPEEFPPAEHDRAWADITGKPATFPPADHSHSWAQVTGKPTKFPPEIGSTASTAVAGNDPRLSDPRTPTDHTHAWGDITGKPTTFDPKVGTTATTAAAGNDPRLSDSRTPTAHRHSWGEIDDKPATFAPTIGTTATTAVAGNDARLTNSRTPTTHTHAWADITNPPTIPDEAPVAAAQADSEATDVEGLVTDFNALLGKLRDAGIIAS